MKTFKILSINVSKKKGQKKNPVEQAELIENQGIAGDAHAGTDIRQVSLLASEDIEPVKLQIPDLKSGDFAENLTTLGIDLPSLPIGTNLFIGNAVLRVSKIGKECHHGCEIKQKTGDCIMPRRGIFAEIIKGGLIKTGDTGTFKD